MEKARFLKVILLSDTQALTYKTTSPFPLSSSDTSTLEKNLDIRFRPKSGINAFKLPISQIKPTVEETWDGITAMAEAIYPEFQQTGGDDEDQFISIG